MLSADDIIRRLDLKPLPLEGGYFRETYRSSDLLPATGKSSSTAIYYLLTPDTFSALHRLPTDEVYHFYLGDPVELVQLGPEESKGVLLGSDLRAGQVPQLVVPRGIWQGSRLLPGGRLALMGTTMAPGFDFSDFEAGQRSALLGQYPNWAQQIVQLTRE